MTVNSQFRSIVRGLLLELDQSFTPGDAGAYDATRHAYRLRFALGRVDEMEHAAIMQSPTYSATRFEIATSILQFDIDRARTFIQSARPSTADLSMSGSVDELAERAA